MNSAAPSRDRLTPRPPVASDAPKSLRLLQAPLVPPPNPKDRGPLCTPAQVAELVFNNQVTGKWVLANLPIALRVKVGRKVCFRLHDAQAHLDSLSSQGGQG